MSTCQAHPIANSSYCFFHDPGKSKERKLASQRGGKGKITVIPRPDLPITPLRNNEEILTLHRNGNCRSSWWDDFTESCQCTRVSAEHTVALLADRSPEPRRYPVQIQDKSERVKELIGRVIENSIVKAKAYGGEIPADWHPVAAAMEEFEEEEKRTTRDNNERR